MQGLRSSKRARSAARLSLAGAVLCVVARVGAYTPNVAEAAPGGTVGMSPGNSSMNPGD